MNENLQHRDKVLKRLLNLSFLFPLAVLVVLLVARQLEITVPGGSGTFGSGGWFILSWFLPIIISIFYAAYKLRNGIPWVQSKRHIWLVVGGIALYVILRIFNL